MAKGKKPLLKPVLSRGERQRRAQRRPVATRIGTTIPSPPMNEVRALGFRTYGEYSASPHWQEVREAYLASERPKKCLCGKPGRQLHHMTYRSLGREGDDLASLRLLCGLCHCFSHGIEV